MPLAARPDDRWVALEIPPQGEVSYETGSFADLAHRPAPSAGIALRVVSQAARLTPPVMSYLQQVALRFSRPRADASSWQLVHDAWQRQTDTSLYFICDAVLGLRAVTAQAAEARARAGAVHHEALIEILRGAQATEGSWDAAWDELQRTVEVAFHELLLSPRVTAEPIRNITPLVVADPGDARRAALLARGWPASADVGTRAGSAAPAQWAKDQRDGGKLLGVWDRSARTFRHPDFQFEPDGRVKAEVKTLLAALAEHPDRTAVADPDGWRRAYWLYQPFRSLSRSALALADRPPGHGTALHDSPEGAAGFAQELLAATSADDARPRTPAEAFAEAPQAVIALARQAAVDAAPDTDVEGLVRGA